MAWTDMTQLTGLVAWYKPETLAATYANGDPISTWADSSGNSRDLTGTTTTRPLAAASAINGYMAAHFDGTDDILSSASYTHSGQLVVSVVFNLDTLKNFNSILAIDDNASPVYPARYSHGFSYSSGNFSAGTDPGTLRYCVMNTAVSSATSHIVSYAFNSATGCFVGTDGRRRTDETSGGTASTPSGTAYMFLGYIGLANGYLDGKIAEVIVYNVSDDSEVPWVEGYLADKYAITLADGHLFKNEAPQSAPTTYNTGTGGTNVAAAKFTRLE